MTGEGQACPVRPADSDKISLPCGVGECNEGVRVEAYARIECLMKKYRTIAHTADIGLIAYGRDLGECFANAALGLFSQITDLRRVRPRQAREVKVEAADVEALLVEWLNELIFLLDSEGFLGRRFGIVEMGDDRLRAEVRGETVDPARHHMRIAVKATTYHQLQVVRCNGWRARVIFDI